MRDYPLILAVANKSIAVLTWTVPCATIIWHKGEESPILVSESATSCQRYDATSGGHGKSLKDWKCIGRYGDLFFIDPNKRAIKDAIMALVPLGFDAVHAMMDKPLA
jgi:hypothetical protein